MLVRCRILRVQDVSLLHPWLCGTDSTEGKDEGETVYQSETSHQYALPSPYYLQGMKAVLRMLQNCAMARKSMHVHLHVSERTALTDMHFGCTIQQCTFFSYVIAVLSIGHECKVGERQNMIAGWSEFVSANDQALSPERYGHSLTTFNYDDILVVCFGGTSGAGVTSQVRTFSCVSTTSPCHDQSSQ